MLLILEDRRKRFLISICRFLNLLFNGFREHPLNKDKEERAEQVQVIVIDYIQQPFIQKWMSLVSLKY